MNKCENCGFYENGKCHATDSKTGAYSSCFRYYENDGRDRPYEYESDTKRKPGTWETL